MNTLKNYRCYIENLDCANCAKRIEDELNAQKNIEKAIVNFSTSTITVRINSQNPLEEIRKIALKLEPGVRIYEEKKETNEKDYELVRLIVGLIIFLVTMIIDNNQIKIPFLILAYAILLYKTVKNAVKKIFKSHMVDENTLVTISAIGAFILGEYSEGFMVVFLYVTGKILEAKAVGKSRKEISNLLDMKIEKANKKVGSNIESIDSSLLEIGDICLVRKGETVPADGSIIKGESTMDTSRLTGESIPTNVKKGDTVLSGSINKGDPIEIEITKRYHDSTAYKIFELTLNATDNKSTRETTITKLARYYTPAVMILAVLTTCILYFLVGITLQDSIYRGLSFLVISCPCAIAISVPLSYFAGIGASSNSKILVKGSSVLDEVNKCNAIIFDKTGTLTEGSSSIKKIDIFDEKYTREKVLKTIAQGEALSTHPLAKIILNEYGSNIDTKDVKNFKEHEGKGISYEIKNKKIRVGSKSFVKTDKDGKFFLAIDGEVIASLDFDDNLKKNAKEIIGELKHRNIKTIMATGDSNTFAKSLAENCGIEEYKSELLPEEKYELLKETQKNHKVMFVGDGINDTPSLIESDIGISMGTIGSNSAIEVSDVVLMNDDLSGIISLLNIAKKTNNIITANLIFAIGVKISILVLATTGFANMALAVFADTGVTLLTILNSLRILK